MAEAQRDDLAAMLVPLARAFTAAERPVLDALGLTMWGYVVLLALDRSAAGTQAELAEAIGADKTRIIDTLDDLQARKLIERRPDPADRRARLVSITPSGRRLRQRAQRAIQRQEEAALGRLSAHERATFLRVLAQLSAVPADELVARPSTR